MNNKLLKFSSLTMVVLGLGHLALTPFCLKNVSCLDIPNRLVFMYLYICTGFGILLPGLVTWILSRKADIITPACGIVVLICSIETMLIGIMSVITMYNNPFAYAFFTFGILLFISVLQVMKK